MDFSTNAASPKQWEGIGFVLNPGIHTFGDAVISYDFTNQRFRNLATITTFNSSKATTEQFDFILDYHDVRIEMDGAMMCTHC